MSKPSGLWQRKRDGAWMTTVNGTQHNLGKDKAEARKQLHKLLAGDNPKPEKAGMTTRKLCDNYLIRTAEGKEAATHAVQVMHLRAFNASLGHRDPATLKVHEVETWLDEQETWSASTKALFITILKAVFNHAEQQGYLAVNPIKKLKRRKTGRRDRVVTPEERGKILGAMSANFRDFVTFLDLTGCRPFSEAARITADDIQFDHGRVVLHRHKTRKKTGKPRVIYATEAAIELLKRLVEEHPAGPVFTNRFGNGWSKNNAGKYIARVCKKLGIEGVTLYNLRTTYISNALVNGVPIEVVAALCGNSPQVIHQHYNSVDKIETAMRAAAQKALG